MQPPWSKENRSGFGAGERLPQPLLGAPPNSCLPGLLKWSEPWRPPCSTVQAFPPPRWGSEAPRAPEPSLGAWIPRPLAKLLRHHLEGSMQPMAGRQQELGLCHLSPPRLQPAHLTGPAQKPRAGLGPRQTCRALAGLGKRRSWARHSEGGRVMSTYRWGHMTDYR